MLRRWKNACATALPVSPEVATRIWIRPSPWPRKLLHGGGQELGAEILERARGAVEELQQDDAVVEPAQDGREGESALDDPPDRPRTELGRRGPASNVRDATSGKGVESSKDAKRSARSGFLDGMVEAAVRGEPREQRLAEAHRLPEVVRGWRTSRARFARPRAPRPRSVRSRAC